MPWNQRMPLSSFWHRPLSAGLPIALAVLALLGSPATAEEAIKESTRSFMVDGKAIAMECFAPDKEGQHPAILLLHGSDGMRDARIYQCLAKKLVRQGYVTLIAHYFERTETERIKPKAIDEKLFVAWRETVRQAVLYAANLPEVDRQQIGLLGFSLGAYLSLAVAAQADVPVAAVADFFGGLPKKLHANARDLPPVLIVHGGKDKTVPVEEALDLEKLLRQHKRTYEKRIYQKQDHLFGGHYLDADARDAWERTLRFFGKYLQPPRVVRAP